MMQRLSGGVVKQVVGRSKLIYSDFSILTIEDGKKKKNYDVCAVPRKILQKTIGSVILCVCLYIHNNNGMLTFITCN